MSGEDNFVARWSRLKREAAQGKAAPAEPETPEREPRDAQQTSAVGAPRRAPEEAEPLLDPATLPPIDSIVAGSDIRAFLQNGVPAALTKAALRRAWSTDPAIRDFIEVAENQWDFTDPTSIPGFGNLDATGDLHKLIAQATGRSPEVSVVSEPGHHEESGEAEPREQECGPIESLEPDDAPEIPDQAGVEIAASQHTESASDIGTPPSRKGHGRALPR